MSETPIVYVAGPITGNPWGCVRAAIHAAAILRDVGGCYAYLPQMSVLHEIVSPEPYEHWIEHGLAMLERCDGLYRMLGRSPGADREVAHAEALGIPVFDVATTLDLQAFICDVRARAVRGG